MTMNDQNATFERRFHSLSSSFYNEDIKSRYWKQKNMKEQRYIYTPQPVARLFKKSAEMERHYNKDLYDFTFNELELFFYSVEPSTITSSMNNVSQVLLYIDWAIETGLTERVNPLSNASTEWKGKFGKHHLKNLWTVNEINKYIKDIPNKQIAVIVSLLYNGVKGKELSELKNLKVFDVNYDDRTLKLTCDSGKERIIKVDELCIRTIQEALKLETFETLKHYDSDKRKKESKLVKTNYVLRKSSNRATTDERVTTQQLHKRVEDVQSWLDEPQLTPTNLERSGILAYAYDLYLRNDFVFNGELVEEVFKKYDVSNYHAKRRMEIEFLNLETIKKVYNIN